MRTIDRSALPRSAPTRPFRCPPIRKSTLDNGLDVWTVCHVQMPMLSLTLQVSRGAASDPPGMEGLAGLTASLLDQGAGRWSEVELHRELARVGTRVEIDVDWDSTQLRINGLSRFAARFIELLAALVVQPALRETEFARVREERLHRLLQSRDAADALADAGFVELLYGSHPYAHLALGSERALASLTIDQVREFHAGVLRPSAATLIAVGDCDHDAICRAAAEVFAGWRGTAAPEGLVPDPPSRGPRLAVVPRAAAQQSVLRIGHVGAARSSPAHAALLAANLVLGGQFVSRINFNLRQAKGYTYGAYSAFEFRRCPGPFGVRASVHAAATGRAIQAVIDEVDAIRGQRPVTPEELSAASAAFSQGSARGFETVEQVGKAVAELALHGLPDDEIEAVVTRVARLTVDEVMAAIERHLDPDRLTALVVGDPETIAPELDKLGFGPPVVLPADRGAASGEGVCQMAPMSSWPRP